MKIAVIGSGYVGLVVGACLAESGNDVVSADIAQKKVDRLSRGEIPIYEPGLEPLIKRNLDEGRLRYTTDVPDAVRNADIIFIAVGTPPGEDGSADLKHVLSVARVIGDRHHQEHGAGGHGSPGPGGHRSRDGPSGPCLLQSRIPQGGCRGRRLHEAGPGGPGC